ncbi:recombinase family protein [Myxococcota bacterium]|nr:recombinase family protein [Myxococcota bacterium]
MPGRKREIPNDVRNFIVKLHKKGYTLQDIADELIRRKTPNVRGGRWYSATIKAVLNQMGYETSRYRKPIEAQKRAKDLRETGLSLAKIADIMMNENIKNSMGRIKWDKNTVRVLLLRNFDEN